MDNQHGANVFHRTAGVRNGSFSDSRVILVRHDDPRLSFISSDPVRFEQGENTPAYVAISREATDQALQMIAERFGVPMDALRAFREEIAANA